MSTCIICHFETEQDDIVLRRSDSECICLRCYARETATAIAMPKRMVRELVAVLAEVDVAQS